MFSVERPLFFRFYDTLAERSDLRMYVADEVVPTLIRDAGTEKFPSVLELQVMDSNCSANAYANKKPLEEVFGTKLTVVCGSFGVVKRDTSVAWLWGGDDFHDADDYLHSSIIGKNVHFWLETDDGLVVDTVQKYVVDTVRRVHEVEIDMSNMYAECLIPGMTKDELRAAGLVYRPADPEVQKKIIDVTSTRLRHKLM